MKTTDYNNFNELNKLPLSFLSKTEMLMIKGGDYVDDLFALLFDTSNLSASDIYINGVLYLGSSNLAILNRCKENFRDLYSTTIGKTIIDSIREKDEQIVLSPEVPLPNNVIVSYDPTGNTLILGNLNNSGANSSINDFAHELYHAYSDIVEGDIFDGGDVKKEINAELFAFMTAIQYDKNNSLTNTSQNSHASTLQYFNPTSNSSSDIQSNANFNNAWNDIILNGNFTNENYNSLISNFLTGSTYGAAYGSYGLTQNNIDINQNLFLDDWFNLFFKDNYTTPVNNGGDGSGNGSNDPWNGNTTFSNWLNTIQNSGYQVYTSYTTTTTTTGGWFQGGYSNGTLRDFTTRETVTSYVEPTMAEWYSAFNNGWNLSSWDPFFGSTSQ